MPFVFTTTRPTSSSTTTRYFFDRFRWYKSLKHPTDHKLCLTLVSWYNVCGCPQFICILVGYRHRTDPAGNDLNSETTDQCPLVKEKRVSPLSLLNITTITADAAARLCLAQLQTSFKVLSRNQLAAGLKYDCTTRGVVGKHFQRRTREMGFGRGERWFTIQSNCR